MREWATRYKPYSVGYSWGEGQRLKEIRDADGFRGPGYELEKPPGTFRILTIGDAAVQGFLEPELDVPFLQTWQQVLQRRLNDTQETTQFEVINAGIGGYVSWQARVRLEDRGLKYRPDLVMVMVGINDLSLSSLANWHPGINATELGRFDPAPPPASTMGAARRFVVRHSHFARLMVQAQRRWSETRSLPRSVSTAGPASFNEEALAFYLRNLEQIHQLVSQQDVTMALVLWPTLLTETNLGQAAVQDKLRFSFSIVPLAATELWTWYQRYRAAQQTFAEQHPDVILLDPATAFATGSDTERLSLFADLSRLTPAGNARLGEALHAELRRRRAFE